jgi:hypothetical protein
MSWPLAANGGGTPAAVPTRIRAMAWALAPETTAAVGGGNAPRLPGALRAGAGPLWVCAGACDARARRGYPPAWWRFLGCRAGAGPGLEPSASWSSRWTPLPPSSSSGGRGSRGCQRRRTGGRRTPAKPGRRGCWRWAAGRQPPPLLSRARRCPRPSGRGGRNAPRLWRMMGSYLAPQRGEEMPTALWRRPRASAPQRPPPAATPCRLLRRAPRAAAGAARSQAERGAARSGHAAQDGRG